MNAAKNISTPGQNSYLKSRSESGIIASLNIAQIQLEQNGKSKEKKKKLNKEKLAVKIKLQKTVSLVVLENYWRDEYIKDSNAVCAIIGFKLHKQV